MRKLAKVAIIAIWIIIFAGLLAAIWIRTPALWFINLPEPAWLGLIDFFGATCCESAADIELAVGFVFGVVAAVSITYIAYIFYRFVKRLTKC